MRCVATKSSSEVSRTAPRGTPPPKSDCTTSSYTAIDRLGMTTTVGPTEVLSTFPEGRYRAEIWMSLVNDGLKIRASVRKLPTLPPTERYRSLAYALVAKTSRQ